MNRIDRFENWTNYITKQGDGKFPFWIGWPKLPASEDQKYPLKLVLHRAGIFTLWASPFLSLLFFVMEMLEKHIRGISPADVRPLSLPPLLFSFLFLLPTCFLGSLPVEMMVAWAWNRRRKRNQLKV